MSAFEEYAHLRLEEREKTGMLRSLRQLPGLSRPGIDFSSNDYLGFSRSLKFQEAFKKRLLSMEQIGSTGSRLLTGNHALHEKLEDKVASIFDSESSLLFSSGYSLNLGLIQCLADGDTILLLDELCHASLKNGARLSQGHTFYFRHNDLDHLEGRLKRHADKRILIVVESVYSMDGDLSPLEELVELAKRYGAEVIVDEAPAIGTIGTEGLGLAYELGVQDQILARVITFGKALGGEGAAVLGTRTLKNYLINFCHSFIYTTGVSFPLLAMMEASLDVLKDSQNLISKLQHNQNIFSEVTGHHLYSPICSWTIQGNERAKRLSSSVQADGFNIFPILSPTIKRGTERIRIVLHAFNEQQDIINLANSLKRHHGQD